MHINLAYLLFALLSVAHVAHTLPSKNNLKQHSARGRPASFDNQVHVKLDYHDPSQEQRPFPSFTDKREPRLKSIFEEWIRNTKLIKMEKDKAGEGKQPTPVNDLPDIPLVPLKIVIEPGSVPVLERIEFWGPGVKDIPGFEKGCETEEDLCWGSAFPNVVYFRKPETDMYYVHVKDGSGVGIKAHHTKVVG